VQQLCHDLAHGSSLRRRIAWRDLIDRGALQRGCEQAVNDPAALERLPECYQNLGTPSARAAAAEVLGGLGIADGTEVEHRVTAARRRIAIAAVAGHARQRTRVRGVEQDLIFWAGRAIRPNEDPPQVVPLPTWVPGSDEAELVRRSFAFHAEFFGDAGEFAPILAEVRRLLAEQQTFERSIQALTDQSAPMRAEAAQRLGVSGDPRAVPPLLRALTDPDAGVRASSAQALGRLRAPQSIQGLIQVLADPNSQVCAEAAQALGYFGGQAVNPLLRALSNRWDDRLREGAARALGYMGRHAVEPLLRAATNPEAWSREDAAQWLRDEDVGQALRYIGPQAVPPLLQALADPDIRWHPRAAQWLGLVGDARAVEPLLRARISGDDALSVAAGAALMRLDERAVELLVEALDHPEAAMRSAAARLLCSRHEVRAAEPLLRTLDDPDADVRTEAAQILVDPQPAIREAVARGVGNLGESAFDLLASALTDEDMGVRAEVARLLGILRDPRAIVPLRALLRSSLHGVRTSAARALDQIERRPREGA
jgi:HEAT repeat protein